MKKGCRVGNKNELEKAKGKLELKADDKIWWFGQPETVSQSMVLSAGKGGEVLSWEEVTIEIW